MFEKIFKIVYLFDDNVNMENIKENIKMFLKDSKKEFFII